MFESFILAGGKSSRMKRDKAFLQLGDKTFLEHSFSKLKQIDSKKITIVVAKNSAPFQNFQTITDIYKSRGTLGGIHSALANCKEKYALIVACDYPFVTTKLLRYLLEIAKKTNKICVTPIQKDGFIQPLCVVYKTQNCLEKLKDILESKEKTPSARNFIKSINTKFVKFEDFDYLPNSEHFFFNVNTPEDFKKAQQIFNDRQI